MNRRTLLTITALGVLTSTGMFYASNAQARELDTGKYSPLVQRLIDKLGLKSEDVDPIISEFQTERQAEKQKMKTDRLNTLVSEGKLTQEQADKVIAKLKEWQDQSGERRDEHEQWFKDNGIDSSLIREIGFRGKGFGGKHDWKE